MAACQECKEVGQKDLANFIYSKRGKSLQDFVDTTWKMHNASSATAEEQTKWIDLIWGGYLKRECCPGCNKLRYKSAIEFLSNNKIHLIGYATALHELIIHGKGKFGNIPIIIPTFCEKMFLLKPLEWIFKTFCNPAKDKYAWVIPIKQK